MTPENGLSLATKFTDASSRCSSRHISLLRPLMPNPCAHRLCFRAYGMNDRFDLDAVEVLGIDVLKTLACIGISEDGFILLSPSKTLLACVLQCLDHKR